MLHRIITFVLKLLTRLFGKKTPTEGVIIGTSDGYMVTDINNNLITFVRGE
jgi:hypothetical protein